MSTHQITLTVNGVSRQVVVPARMTLADLLRDELDLVGTHVGCEHGVCGTCTVTVDGEAARSCTLLAVSLDGAVVRTVEGIADGAELNPIQRAFRDFHALQCGFCTPGYLMTLEALRSRENAPSPEELRDALAGVVCRCTGYDGILAAAKAAVAEHYGQAKG
jgi:aerobic carbon-monoxide dehydrogenase small subunit